MSQPSIVTDLFAAEQNLIRAQPWPSRLTMPRFCDSTSKVMGMKIEGNFFLRRLLVKQSTWLSSMQNVLRNCLEGRGGHLGTSHHRSRLLATVLSWTKCCTLPFSINSSRKYSMLMAGPSSPFQGSGPDVRSILFGIVVACCGQPRTAWTASQCLWLCLMIQLCCWTRITPMLNVNGQV